MILVSTKTTPYFSYGGGIISPGEKIQCTMSADGDFNQLIYIFEDSTAVCTPLDTNCVLGPKILNPGPNDLSEYRNIPVEFKNIHCGTDLDVGSKWFAIKPRPMSDSYAMSLIQNGQAIVGNSLGRFIVVVLSKATIDNTKVIPTMSWAQVPDQKTVTVNLNTGALAFLIEKI